MSMGEIKDAVARVARLSQKMGGNYCPSLIEPAVHDLVTEGKLIVIDQFTWRLYVSRRHVPRFRTLDADWQW
jgi:hypothetical protein